MQRKALSLLAVLLSTAACQTAPPPQVQLDPAPLYDGRVTPVTGKVVIRVQTIADPAPYDEVSTLSLASADGSVRHTREHTQGRITGFRNTQGDLITEITIERRNEQALSPPATIDIRHDPFRNPKSVQTNLEPTLASHSPDGASLVESLKRRMIPLKPAGYGMNEIVYTHPVADAYFKADAPATCRLGGETVFRGRRSYFLACSGDGFADTPAGKVMVALDGYQIIDADTALVAASHLRVIGNGPGASFSGVDRMTVSLKETATSAPRTANDSPPAAQAKPRSKPRLSRLPSTPAARR